MIGNVAVIDIGKTNAKVVLVDLHERLEIAVHKKPNAIRHDGPYPHHDVDDLWRFVLDALRDLVTMHMIDALTVTTHGATAALLGRDGRLVMPVLDYESDFPDAIAQNYEAKRPAFEETGSPRLPNGLNLGVQLFWLSQFYPTQFSQTAAVLMYPQYWVHRLTGIAVGEVTSLGCHTDLWNPSAGDYSTLVDRCGWRELMPPIRAAKDPIGVLLPSVAEATGLPLHTPVYCGIHDSNASLVPHLLAREKPFSVVSTGTWVVSMAVGASPVSLDNTRDTLINVSAEGDRVPSARFMGGREFELVSGGTLPQWNEGDMRAVLQGNVFLLPSVQQGSGPFPKRTSTWSTGTEPPAGERQVALSFYLALMTAVGLELIGAGGQTIVEGPFAHNDLYMRMLATATARPVVAGAAGGTGTAIGAALLVYADAPPSLRTSQERRILPEPAWFAYATAWNATTAGWR